MASIVVFLLLIMAANAFAFRGQAYYPDWIEAGKAYAIRKAWWSKTHMFPPEHIQEGQSISVKERKKGECPMFHFIPVPNATVPTYYIQHYPPRYDHDQLVFDVQKYKKGAKVVLKGKLGKPSQQFVLYDRHTVTLMGIQWRAIVIQNEGSGRFLGIEKNTVVQKGHFSWFGDAENEEVWNIFPVDPKDPNKTCEIHFSG